MIEACPARTIDHDPSLNIIPETSIPAECMRCIYKAIESKKQFSETALLPVDQGPERQAIVEYGFDLGTSLHSQSYMPGTETELMRLAFNCPEENYPTENAS